jgi:hypothetical protein
MATIVSAEEEGADATQNTLGSSFQDCENVEVKLGDGDISSHVYLGRFLFSANQS